MQFEKQIIRPTTFIVQIYSEPARSVFYLVMSGTGYLNWYMCCKSHQLNIISWITEVAKSRYLDLGTYRTRAGNLDLGPKGLRE